MVKVENVTKTFGDFKALDQAALHVKKGAVYGLVGPNGAGKSTIIRHITGVYRPDSGTVLVDGVPVYENPAAKGKIAYIPDDLFYFLQADTLEMKRFYKGIYKNFDEKLFEKLREFFPTIDVRRSIRRLSKGMQKQVAFWLSICTKPELMVLDEPVDGLDPVMRRQIWGIILSEAADYNTTVLVSSHNLRELEDVCDHVGIMDHGKVLLERSLAQLQDTTVKLQVVFREDREAPPPEIPVLHASRIGRVHTLIMRMSAQEAEARLAAYDPLLVDAVPLTLEEIFIYELGGVDYAVKDIVL